MPYKSSSRRKHMDRILNAAVRTCLETGAIMRVLDRCYICDEHRTWRPSSCGGSGLNGLRCFVTRGRGKKKRGKKKRTRKRSR